MTNPLDRLATLMWDGHNQYWSARARGSNAFVHHADPEEAILMAIENQDQIQLEKQHADESDGKRDPQAPAELL